MSSFLCSSETLSLIAERLADRASRLGKAHGGDIDFWFKKVLKMNRIASNSWNKQDDVREYIQQRGKRFIKPVDIAIACWGYEYQTAGYYTARVNKKAALHILDFENNKTMQIIRTIGYTAAMLALRNAVPHECMRADKEWWR